MSEPIQIYHPDGRTSTCSAEMLAHWQRDGWVVLPTTEAFFAHRRAVPKVTTGAYTKPRHRPHHVLVLVVTCDRQRQTAQLLWDVYRTARQAHRADHRVSVLVVDDGRTPFLPTYTPGMATHIHRMDDGASPHGKDGFYQVVTEAFQAARDLRQAWRWNTLVWIPDDAILGTTFLLDALHWWDHIKDPKAAALNFIVDEWRQPTQERYPGRLDTSGAYMTQWMDCSMLAPWQSLKAIGWTADMAKGRHPKASSGVGDALSTALTKFGNIYQTPYSLLDLRPGPSTMFPGKPRPRCVLP